MTSPSKDVSGFACKVECVLIHLEAIVEVQETLAEAVQAAMGDDQRTRVVGQLMTLIDTNRRYLSDVKRLCDFAQHGGRND